MITINKELILSTVEKIDRLVDWDASLTTRKEFIAELMKGRQLRIKFGADITAKTLHIGHAVNLRAMRHLQDLGHRVIFLLGGFTTLVGDPTDKLQARVAPDASDIERNKKEFIEQIKTIIRFDDPLLIETRDNTEWWGTLDEHGTIPLGEFFNILKSITVSQMASRSMFKKRTENETPIFLSEFLYPVLQGYDSVLLKSDITIVGSDQMFNEKMAWGFQEKAGQNKQMILCTKITPGLDGGAKQSKSLGNYVGLNFSPYEKFNKVMLLLDSLIFQWFSVYTDIPSYDIEKLQDEYKDNLLGFKKRLALCITSSFHGEVIANNALVEYEKNRKSKRVPMDFDSVSIKRGSNFDEILRGSFKYTTNGIIDLLSKRSIGVVASMDSERNFVENIVLSKTELKEFLPVENTIIRIGKKFYRIKYS